MLQKKPVTIEPIIREPWQMLNHDKKKPVTKPSNLDQIYDLKTAQTTTASPSIATHKSAHAQAKYPKQK